MGRHDGVEVGILVGTDRGWPVGCLLGVIDGLQLGCREGRRVGCIEGCICIHSNDHSLVNVSVDLTNAIQTEICTSQFHKVHARMYAYNHFGKIYYRIVQ